MGIFKYNVLNPITSSKMPFFDKRKGIFYVPVKAKYRYFIEASVDVPGKGRKYYLLLGKVKFDANCRLCTSDDYGRCQIKIKGEMKDFVIAETDDRGNIEVDYVESEEQYDVFEVL